MACAKCNKKKAGTVKKTTPGIKLQKDGKILTLRPKNG